MRLRKFWRIVSMTTILGFVAPCFANDLEMMELSNNLGNVLASESFCELSYSQDAISAFIEANVPADNMSFASQLQMMTQANEMQLNGMSASSKTAHCTQIKRVAKNYGFID